MGAAAEWRTHAWGEAARGPNVPSRGDHSHRFGGPECIFEGLSAV
jgi:hypothetical protein